MSKFEIVDATESEERIPVSFAISGGAGSGKTKTALMIAYAIAEDQRVGMVDTECGRGLEYRKTFSPTYRYIALKAPYSPLRYEAAIQALINDGCKAIVVDSGSHAWEEEGGIKESVDAFCKAQAKQWNSKPEKYTAPGWAKFRPIHRHMIHFASRNQIPTIWCFRAREKTRVENVIKTDNKGNERKTIEFVSQGWQPITSDLASFDTSAFIMLEPVLETGCEPGTILRLKVTDPLKPFLEVGKQVDQKAIQAMAEYARTQTEMAQKPAEGTRTPSEPNGHSDTADQSSGSEGAAVRQQMGMQHEPPEFQEDDDPGFGGLDEQIERAKEIEQEDPVVAARRLWGVIKRAQTTTKIKDLVPQVMELGGKVPDETYTKLTDFLTAQSNKILEAEKAA